jgi:magnesium transporter
MIKFYKTNLKNEVEEIEAFDNNCWINITNPLKEELELLSSNLDVPLDFFTDPLDVDERPRVEYDDDTDTTLIILKYPIENPDSENIKYSTEPLGIIKGKNFIITVSKNKNSIISLFEENKVKNFSTYKRSRFILQIFFKMSNLYLKYLSKIHKETDMVEEELRESMKNKELIDLLNIEKSLVYFTTSLKANEIVLERLSKGNIIPLYEEDEDMLEDVIIENKQAIEMCDIYSSILSGMMDAFASVISNNLNIVMKVLTLVTIIMQIPTIITSFFGMNVRLPLMKNPLAWIYIILMSAVSAAWVIFWFKKRRFM